MSRVTGCHRFRCDKAEAQAEVSSFQLRSLRCQLKPLEAQLAREEAILTTMSQELEAGDQVTS